MIIIDAFAFGRSSEQQAGKLSLDALERLRAECVSEQGEVEWRLSGKMHASGYAGLQLEVNAQVQLRCQRCLEAFSFGIESITTIVLADNEEQADEIDAALEDDAIEVVTGSRSFDIQALIEDEVLLAIPLSPKHEVCPAKEKLDAFAMTQKESPFAALKDQIRLGQSKPGGTKN